MENHPESSGDFGKHSELSALPYLKYIPLLWTWTCMIFRAFKSVAVDRWKLSQHVHLIDAQVDDHLLRKNPPQLSISFIFLNGSVYDIAFAKVSGRFRHSGDLSGDIEASANAASVGRGKILRVSVTQWISESESQEILKKSEGGSVHIGTRNVRIYAIIHGPMKTEAKHVLQVGDEIRCNTRERWEVKHLIRDLMLTNGGYTA